MTGSKLLNLVKNKPRGYRDLLLWTLLGTIQRPSDYESDALTNSAKGPAPFKARQKYKKYAY